MDMDNSGKSYSGSVSNKSSGLQKGPWDSKLCFFSVPIKASDGAEKPEAELLQWSLLGRHFNNGVQLHCSWAGSPQSRQHMQENKTAGIRMTCRELKLNRGDRMEAALKT